MEEVSRNLATKWGLSAKKVERRQGRLRTAFPEAWVTGYEGLIPSMRNELKDRHVLAAAVHSGAQRIVTYNLKDFPKEQLRDFGIECVGPSVFLQGLYDLNPDIAVHKIEQQANDIGLTLEKLLKGMMVNVREFVTYFCEAEQIRLG